MNIVILPRVVPRSLSGPQVGVETIPTCQRGKLGPIITREHHDHRAGRGHSSLSCYLRSYVAAINYLDELISSDKLVLFRDTLEISLTPGVATYY
jgi:hypothetical protein